MRSIDIRGAREHNLRSVDLSLPMGCLVVFCGVSGSGKSSLAFDTLHAEGRRRYVEALSLRLGHDEIRPPAFDSLSGLPPTVGLAQRQAQGSPHATLGAMILLDSVLQVLFARAGQMHCPRCGRAITPTTHDEIVDTLLSLPAQTRLTLQAPVALGDSPPLVLDEIRRAGFSRVDLGDGVTAIEEVEPKRLEGRHRLQVVIDRIRIDPQRDRSAQRSRIHDSVRLGARVGRGILIAVSDGKEQMFVDRPYCAHDDLPLPALEPRLLSPRSPDGACPSCEGTGQQEGKRCVVCSGSRLSEVAAAVRWRGCGLGELQHLPLAALRQRLDAAVQSPHRAPDPVEAIALPDLLRRIDRLVMLGLGHLPPDHLVARLTGSELQRARLARQVAEPLSGVLYALDEPTAGLDAACTAVVIALMRELIAAGNTVIAVEHAPEVLRAADHLVEFGPGAGVLGGRIVYRGTLDGLLAADTPTGRWLSGRERMAPRTAALPEASERVTISGPWCFGAGQTVVLPRARFVAVTGPPASGKSRLIEILAETLGGAAPPPDVSVAGAAGLSRPVLADRGAARAIRSNPATYIGLWDILRELLASTKEASVRGLSASAFSLATVGGRCEACKGTGERKIDMGPLPEVVSRCTVCDGRRFQRDVLEVRWKGLDASELLLLSADQARPILAGHPRIDESLHALIRVGLGYLPLGQSVHSLSGGEARRMVLARELARAMRRGARDTVYLLDDPSAGLHPADTALLVSLLRDLTAEGASVWAATVDTQLVCAADEVVLLSPGLGMDCG